MLPFAALDEPVVRGGSAIGGEFPSELGKIQPIIQLDLRQPDLAKRMQPEPFPRRVERHMRPVDAKGYEEGLCVLPLQLADDPAGILVIVALLPVIAVTIISIRFGLPGNLVLFLPSSLNARICIDL